MRDYFGQDTPESDGSPAATPPTPAPAPITPVAPGAAAPTLAQAVDKAVAKATADQVVATDPHAVHAVNLVPAAPTALGSAVTGAAAGALIGGPPGALVGGTVMYVIERYQIGGGPVGKVWKKLKGHFHKVTGAAPAALAATPAAPATPHAT